MDIIKNFPLSKITTLGIGGPSKEFIIARTEGELKEALSYAKEKNLKTFLIGGGSNLLVSDVGVDFLVIKNEIAGMKLEGEKVKVFSGTGLQELVDFTIEHNLSGLENLTGIPGSVGGAIFGNAGAYGQTISDHLESVSILNEEGESKDLSKDECGFNYRDSMFKKNGLIILEVTFSLDKGDREQLQNGAKEILSQRLIKYPTGIKCPGSFFKNIIAETLPKEIIEKLPTEKVPYGKVNSGYLLEEVGAKGAHLGDIEIATYHANLFVNIGNGTAKDFYNLAKEYKEKVKNKFGISLEPEVQLVNLPPI